MVQPSTDAEFLTPNLQRLLLLIYHNNRVKFKTQEIYKNQEWFKKEIRKLILFQKVECHNGISNDGRTKEEYYTLNIAGKVFVENFIIKYQKRLKNE